MLRHKRLLNLLEGLPILLKSLFFLYCAWHSLGHLQALHIYENEIKKNPDNLAILTYLSGTYNNIGNNIFEKSVYHKRLGVELKTALDYQLKALKIQEKIEDIRGEIHSHINMANIY